MRIRAAAGVLGDATHMLPDENIAPFQLPKGVFERFPRPIATGLRSGIERALGFPHLNFIYAKTQQPDCPGPFSEAVLREMGIRFILRRDDLSKIPKSGPLIVVANHPFGGADGLFLLAMLLRVRPDVRLLANYILHKLPAMRPSCFFVDPFGGEGAAERNLKSTKAAIRWVRDGGVLGVFPSGEVSHLTLKNRGITDPPWGEAAAKLIRATKADVVPVFFDGANGRLFQISGLLHHRLRTAMLSRELVSKSNRRFRVAVGHVIPHARMEQVSAGDEGATRDDGRGAARLTEYLRGRTYVLKARFAIGARRDARRARQERPHPIPVGAAQPADRVAADVAALPAEACLVDGGKLRVYTARAGEIPALLREIGRLRELTFRGVGEGTGKSIDLDRFDEHYLHLFVWDAAASKVVGAYRLGLTDELLERFGPRGLYTSTLFDYQPALLRQLCPAVEMGRSFVAPEYQRDYSPLMMLWKGIGHFAVRYPRYRQLFGAVSISDEFQSMTRELLMSFLKCHRMDAEMAALVRPKNPPKAMRVNPEWERFSTLVSNLDEVAELVGEIEAHRRSVPVLLKQYLRLNGRLLGFNVDREFGDVLDGLILVDLATVDRPILDRYMGRSGAADFLSRHAACR